MKLPDFTNANIIRNFNAMPDEPNVILVWQENKMHETGDGEYITDDGANQNQVPTLTHHDKYWHQWTMPGYLDCGEIHGPFDTILDAQADAVQVHLEHPVLTKVIIAETPCT